MYFVIVLDPADCASFFMCSYGVVGFNVQKFDCEHGFLFDIRYKVCNYDYAVDCGDRPRPGIVLYNLIFLIWWL